MNIVELSQNVGYFIALLCAFAIVILPFWSFFKHRNTPSAEQILAARLSQAFGEKVAVRTSQDGKRLYVLRG